MTVLGVEAPPPVEAFGFRVNPGTMEQYLSFTASAIARREPVTLFDHNLHSLYMYFRHPYLRRLYDSATVMVDGMPLVALLRLAGFDVERRHRVTWVDYVWPLLHQAAARGWRVFYLGSDPETHDRALATIRERLPTLQIIG